MNKKKNILIISHYNMLYGANRVLFNIITSLKNDFNFFVVTPVKGSFNDILTENNIKNKSVGILFKYSYWIDNGKKDTTQIIKIIDNIRLFASVIYLSILVKYWQIDLIHSSSTVINIGAYLRKITGVKHLWHFQEYVEEDYGYKFVPDIRSCMNFINSNSDKIITVSDGVKKKYEKYFDQNKIKRIYNGIKINGEVNHKKKYINFDNDKDINLLIVGLVKKTKGHSDAINAIEKLINEGYYNLKLQIIGDGPHLNYYKSVVKNKHLEKNVEFLGYKKDITIYLDKALIGLVCSINEAFGLVTIEYLNSGVVVIGTNTGGTMEIIKHLETGLLYSPGDYLQLAALIKKLINDSYLYNRIRQNGFLHVEKLFSLEKQVEQFKEVYLGIINNVQ